VCEVKNLARGESAALVSPKDGYDLRLVVLSCCWHWRKIAAGRSPDDDSGALLTSAQARAESAQAQERELRVGVLQGRYVSREAVRRKWEEVAISFRECALGTAGKIADSVASAQGREEVSQIIDSEMRELLETLSGGDDIDATVASKRWRSMISEFELERLILKRISPAMAVCERGEQLIATCAERAACGVSCDCRRPKTGTLAEITRRARAVEQGCSRSTHRHRQIRTASFPQATDRDGPSRKHLVTASASRHESREALPSVRTRSSEHLADDIRHLSC
jgi:hypothetical protein